MISAWTRILVREGFKAWCSRNRSCCEGWGSSGELVEVAVYSVVKSKKGSNPWGSIVRNCLRVIASHGFVFQGPDNYDKSLFWGYGFPTPAVAELNQQPSDLRCDSAHRRGFFGRPKKENRAQRRKLYKNRNPGTVGRVWGLAIPREVFLRGRLPSGSVRGDR